MRVNVAVALYTLLFFLPITFLFKLTPEYLLNKTEELTFICKHKSMDNKMFEEKNPTYRCKLHIVTTSKLWRKLIKSKSNEYLKQVDIDVKRTMFFCKNAQFLIMSILSNCMQIGLTFAAMKFTIDFFEIN